jgi:multiple sugar transport system permease protein
MMTAYMNTLPKELDEAVMIDGGSRLKALWYVLVPTSVPGLVSVGMYTFMRAWNEYLFASVFINSSSLRTLPLGLNQLFYTQHYVWGRMMAASVLTAIPVIVLFLSVEKFITGGLTFGGVKE